MTTTAAHASSRLRAGRWLRRGDERRDQSVPQIRIVRAFDQTAERYARDAGDDLGLQVAVARLLGQEKQIIGRSRAEIKRLPVDLHRLLSRTLLPPLLLHL